jgi:pimeloyl-ACP methyl ester carboxylesterase
MTLPDGRRLCWHEFGDPGGTPVIYTAGTPVSGLCGGSYDEAARAAGLRIEFEAVADALRQGTRGAVQEVAMTKRPWPFSLSEINTSVHLWHGARDTNAPIAMARNLARELPDATLHVSDTSGHDVGHDRSGEIMSVIVSHARSA